MTAILSTSLAVATTDWAATWQLASVTGVQVGHVCAVESELAQVTGIGPGLKVTLRRGIDATASAAHGVSTPVAVYRASEAPTAPPVAAGLPVLRQAVQTLTHAQILTLKTVPQTLIPPPGVTKRLEVQTVTLVAHFVSPYTGDADYDALLLVYTPGVTAQIASLFNGQTGEIALRNFLSNQNGSTDHVTRLPVPQTTWAVNYGETAPANQWRPLVETANRAVALASTMSAVTGGTAANTLTVSLLYGVIDVTTGVWV